MNNIAHYFIYLLIAMSFINAFAQTRAKVTTKTSTYINGKLVEQKETVSEMDDQQLQRRFRHLYPTGKGPVHITCPHHHHHHHHHHQHKGAATKRSDPEAALDKRGDPIDQTTLAAIELKEKMAVVYIGIKTKSGMNYSSGAGTFVSKEGHLITNFHVADAFITNDKYKPEFVLRDGRSFSNFKIIECHGNDKDDLCLLKLEHTPEYWFESKNIAADIPAPGEKLFMIGHPSGNNWDVRAGESTGALYRIQSRDTDRLEVTVPVRPGFSGGPIFNKQGDLVCLASDRIVNSVRGRFDKNTLRHFCVEGYKMRSYLMRSGLLN